MAKKTISKDDYDAAWSIINYKNGYESGKAQGLSGYEKNHTDAQPHYDYLKKNNPELYNMLMTSDYNTAKNAMQNQYTMEYTPTQTASANNTFLTEKVDEGFGIYNMMHTDPNYGKETIDAFSAYGKSEGNQAAAGAAADNGGNFGSFADYNKKNTELAYKVAGENALQAKRDGYATGFSKMFTSASNGLNDSSGQFLNYDYQTKKIEADERMNQDDNKTTLAGYASDERIADKELEGVKDTNDTNERMNTEDNNTTLKVTEMTPASDDYAAYNVLLSMWPVNETEKRAFIEGFIKPIYEGKETITPEGLKQLILTNTEKYNIDVDDATKICQAFDVSTDWLNQYRDRTEEDGNVTWYDNSSQGGQYGGMIAK